MPEVEHAPRIYVNNSLRERESRLAEAKLRQIAALNELTSNPMLTMKEASAALRIPDGTLRDWVRRGELQVVRLGRRVFVSVAEVKRILAGGNAK